jgi:hypothetical protein
VKPEVGELAIVHDWSVRGFGFVHANETAHQTEEASGPTAQANGWSERFFGLVSGFLRSARFFGLVSGFVHANGWCARFSGLATVNGIVLCCLDLDPWPFSCRPVVWSCY